MQDYRIETRVEIDGSLTISGLPFQAGDRVEVIVRSQKAGEGNGERHPSAASPSGIRIRSAVSPRGIGEPCDDRSRYAHLGLVGPRK